MRRALDPYYPLTPGRTMAYRVSDPELPAGSGRALRTVRRADERDTGVYAEVEERVEAGGMETVRRYEVLVSILGVREGTRWILKSPLEPGTAWEDEADAVEIRAVDDTVTVPAGTFEGCVRVVYANEDTGGGAIWLREGVGVVKAEQYGERGPFLYELQSFWLDSAPIVP